MATVFWIVDGQQYIIEADRSARTVERHMPNVKRILFAPNPGNIGTGFTEIRKLPPREHAVWYLDFVRYFGLAVEGIKDETQVCLDTDTWVCNPFPDVFTALDKYDLVGVHAPGRGTSITVGEIPSCFCEINIGMIGIKRSDRTIWFTQQWYKKYREHQAIYQTDQGALRETLWNSKLRVWIAPPEYNCRWGFGGFARLPIRILHGRPQDGDYERVCREVNWSTDLRAWRRGQIS